MDRSVAQAVKCLLGKWEVLSSNPSSIKKKKKKEYCGILNIFSYELQEIIQRRKVKLIY
jgi:hypothetical protein